MNVIAPKDGSPFGPEEEPRRTSPELLVILYGTAQGATHILTDDEGPFVSEESLNLDEIKDAYLDV